MIPSKINFAFMTWNFINKNVEQRKIDGCELPVTAFNSGVQQANNGEAERTSKTSSRCRTRLFQSWLCETGDFFKYHIVRFAQIYK